MTGRAPWVETPRRHSRRSGPSTGGTGPLRACLGVPCGLPFAAGRPRSGRPIRLERSVRGPHTTARCDHSAPAAPLGNPPSGTARQEPRSPWRRPRSARRWCWRHRGAPGGSSPSLPPSRRVGPSERASPIPSSTPSGRAADRGRPRPRCPRTTTSPKGRALRRATGMPAASVRASGHFGLGRREYDPHGAARRPFWWRVIPGGQPRDARAPSSRPLRVRRWRRTSGARL